MKNGMIRGAIGTLCLVFAATVANDVIEYETMSPEEISAVLVSPEDLKFKENVESAINDGTGPVYEEVIEECNQMNAEFDRAKRAIPLVVNVVQRTEGQPLNFQFYKCVDQELNEKAFFAAMNPRPREANDSYKQFIIEGNTTLAGVVGGLGGLLVTGGLLAARKQEEEMTPSGRS